MFVVLLVFNCAFPEARIALNYLQVLLVIVQAGETKKGDREWMRRALIIIVK
jgi:hypothetical protein